MQLVVPEEGVGRVGLEREARAVVDGAVALVTGHVGGSGPVEVAAGVVVDIEELIGNKGLAEGRAVCERDGRKKRAWRYIYIPID